ncbi:MAG: hypothetical protein WBL06_11460 [Pseudolysinimonas sp.]|jgi:hypothetical protein|uniref:hypothetical protein n=1 Tax=Pseudolysinimonas sp. TaxID=2680009 RepID=UPI003C71C270
MRQRAQRKAMRRRVAAVALASLALALTACATGEAGGTGLMRAGCPAEIRIQTDDLPRVEWGFLYGLLDRDQLRTGYDSVTAPLLVDGEPSGSNLRIFVADPDDGVAANIQLHDDDRFLLGAVDTDVALLDAGRFPTVGVFAPLRRSPRLAYWDASVYPEVPTVQQLGDRLVPDGSGLVPFVTTPGDPFASYGVGAGVVTAEQLVTEPPPSVQGLIDAGGIPVHLGDVFTDPYRFEVLTETPEAFGSHLLDDSGYQSDSGVLSATPQTLVRYADCLTMLVPILQQALVDYLDDPDETNALLVTLSAKFGDDRYDADAVARAFQILEGDHFAGNGRDGTIGDIDLGRLRDLFETAGRAWREAGTPVPQGVEPDSIVTNRFIDPSIGR